MTDNTFKHREAWLHAVAERMRPMFEAAEFPMPRNVRLTCGFPHIKSFAAKNQRIGECWGEANSGDGQFEIMVSPVLEEPMRVAGVLAHELVHAAVGLECGHKGNFRKLATAIGLEGRMSATTEGEAFKQAVAPILDAVGPYPHATISFPGAASNRPKKQTTRLIKVSCPMCNYTVRVAQKWLDEAGAPHCPQHGAMEVEE